MARSVQAALMAVSAAPPTYRFALRARERPSSDFRTSDSAWAPGRPPRRSCRSRSGSHDVARAAPPGSHSSCAFVSAPVARQDERPLRLGTALVVRVGRQPDRLVAVTTVTLAEEGDPLRLGLAPAAFAHDLVHPPQESGAALGVTGGSLACRRRMVGPARNRAVDGRSPASHDH